MKTLIDHLAQYADYHRDRRNVATHFVGVPMIFVAVAILLSRPVWLPAGWPLEVLPLSPAVAVTAAAVLFWLRLDRPLGLAMLAVSLLSLWIGARAAAASTPAWLGWGVGLFVIGWIIQFVGHYWEGRKPAFVDDLVGLLVGPLFVVAETAFVLGMRRPLRDAINARLAAQRPVTFADRPGRAPSSSSPSSFAAAATSPSSKSKNTRD
jgi:uncharacterized membrane protein YGL010W